MKRGEIRWVRFSPPDKRRPVLILTRDSAIEYLDSVTVAPLTTTIRDIPSEVVLRRQEGLPEDCAVNCDHLQTIPKSRIGPRVACLSAERREEVTRAIRFALDL